MLTPENCWDKSLVPDTQWMFVHCRSSSGFSPWLMVHQRYMFRLFLKKQTCWISLRDTALRCFRFESAFAMLLLPPFENVRISITIKRCHKPLDSSNNRSTLAGSRARAPCKHSPNWGMPCWAFRCLPTFLQGRLSITVQTGLAEVRETHRDPRNFKSDNPPDWLDHICHSWGSKFH